MNKKRGYGAALLRSNTNLQAYQNKEQRTENRTLYFVLCSLLFVRDLVLEQHRPGFAAKLAQALAGGLAAVVGVLVG